MDAVMGFAFLQERQGARENIETFILLFSRVRRKYYQYINSKGYIRRRNQLVANFTRAVEQLHLLHFLNQDYQMRRFTSKLVKLANSCKTDPAEATLEGMVLCLCISRAVTGKKYNRYMEEFSKGMQFLTDEDEEPEFIAELCHRYDDYLEGIVPCHPSEFKRQLVELLRQADTDFKLALVAGSTMEEWDITRDDWFEDDQFSDSALVQDAAIIEQARRDLDSTHKEFERINERVVTTCSHILVELKDLPEEVDSSTLFYSALLAHQISEYISNVLPFPETRKEFLNTEYSETACLKFPICQEFWFIIFRKLLVESGETDGRVGTPIREMLLYLVEHPKRFVRYPCLKAMQPIKSRLRSLAPFFTGFHPEVEQQSLTNALRNEESTPDNIAYLYGQYLAGRCRDPDDERNLNLEWLFESSVSIRKTSRLIQELADRYVLPDAEEILTSYRVETTDFHLKTRDDLEFERLLLEEEEQETDRAKDDIESRRLSRIPFAPKPRVTEIDDSPRDPPLRFLYVLNFGSDEPRTAILETSRDALQSDLVTFCNRHRISTMIPEASIANAINHYLFDVPDNLKMAWPCKERVGSIYWKKIKRDDLRIYLRESNEGIYLHLLPRKQWMRAADLRRRF